MVRLGYLPSIDGAMTNSWILGLGAQDDVLVLTESTNIKLPLTASPMPGFQVGDEVFLWKSHYRLPGVVAQCAVTGSGRLFVELLLTRTWKFEHVYVKRRWFENDPVLRKYTDLEVSSGNRLLLNFHEGKRLADLVRHAGRDWNREESMVGLLTYIRTQHTSVSQLPGSPVSEAAMLVGRAVRGMYDKVMNFQALNPLDDRQGMRNASDVDEAVWEEFFDKEVGRIRVADLETQVVEAWGTLQKTSYREYGEAPNDDPAELALFALRVRRGQPKFRKNILKAYGERCCISRHGPPAVLEAAHIVPHARSGINVLDNGLLMRSDLHALFDQNLLKVHPTELAVVLHKSLKDTPYIEYHEKPIAMRLDGKGPAQEFLAERWEAPVVKLGK